MRAEEILIMQKMKKIVDTLGLNEALRQRIFEVANEVLERAEKNIDRRLMSRREVFPAVFMIVMRNVGISMSMHDAYRVVMSISSKNPLFIQDEFKPKTARRMMKTLLEKMKMKYTVFAPPKDVILYTVDFFVRWYLYRTKDVSIALWRRPRRIILTYNDDVVKFIEKAVDIIGEKLPDKPTKTYISGLYYVGLLASTTLRDMKYVNQILVSDIFNTTPIAVRKYAREIAKICKIGYEIDKKILSISRRGKRPLFSRSSLSL